MSICLVLASLLLWASVASAFDINYDIQPRVLRIGEAATCTFRVQGLQNAPMPQLPMVEGIQISGPEKQDRVDIHNGRVSKSVAYVYRLTPTKTGTFTFGPFPYSAAGQKVEVPEVKLQVVAPAEGRFSGQGEPQLRDMLFAKLELERDTVYTQEFFDLYVSIYHRGIRLGREIKPLQYPEGMSFGNLQELRSTRAVIDGQIFEVLRLRSRAQALTAGQFSLNPSLQVQLVIQDPRNSRRSFFESFLNRNQIQPVQITPAPIALTVKPLPEDGQPRDFSGAVGQFAFDVDVSPVELTAGDPITIRTTISGKGNVAAVSAPQIVLGDNFKVYEPKLTEQNVEATGTKGRKLFEQVIIPRTDAQSELPALRFSYFDPGKEQYATLTRGPFPLQIAPAPDGGARMLESGGFLSKAQRDVLGRDIVYIKPAPAEWSRVSAAAWYGVPAFLALQLLPPVLLGIVFLAARRRDSLATDVAKARRLRAPKSASAGLRKAERALKSDDRTGFYEGLWEAMASYFGNRLNLAAGDVTLEHVVQTMSDAGLQDEDMSRIQRLYRVCEESRFGVSLEEGAESAEQARSQMKTHVAELNRVLKACEKVRV